MKNLLKLIFMFILVIFYSCTDQLINTVVDNREVNRINKTLMSLDSSIISPDKPLCGTKDVTVWLFDHYEPKTGKIFGIWPHQSWKNDLNKLTELRTKWGFNYIVLPYSDGISTRSNYINSGFTMNKIMVTIYDFEHANQQWVIDTFTGAYAFYADEPNTTNEWRNYQLSFLGMPEYIDIHSPNSLFITGSYKPNDGFDGYVSVTDKVLFTGYCRYYEPLPGIWTSYDCITDGQRWNWTDFKNRYPSKSKSNWIGTHEDQSEYEQLLGHALNLGLNEIWLYSNGNSSWDEIAGYASHAFNAGWLRGFERKFVYEYHCYYDDPCDCDPTLSDGWYVYKIWRFNDIREIFPQPQ